MKFYNYINEAEKYFYRWCNLGEIAKIFNGKRPTSLDVTANKNFHFSSQSGRPKIGKGWISEVYVKLYLNAGTLKKLGWQEDNQAKGESLWRPKGVTLDKNALKQYLKAIEKIEVYEWPKNSKKDIISWIKFRLDNVKIEFKGKINEANIEKGTVTEEEAKKYFEPVAEQQRGRPESMMMKIQRTLGGGILSPIVEHTGDLLHRMTEMGYDTDFGYEYVREKVNRIHRYLSQSYGFEREFQENLKNNAQYFDMEEKELKDKITKLLEMYKKEHSKLPVYNWLQRQAQLATIYIGEQDWGKAERAISNIKKFTRNKDAYIEAASTVYRKNGKIISYKGE